MLLKDTNRKHQRRLPNAYKSH